MKLSKIDKKDQTLFFKGYDLSSEDLCIWGPNELDAWDLKDSILESLIRFLQMNIGLKNLQILD